MDNTQKRTPLSPTDLTVNLSRLARTSDRAEGERQSLRERVGDIETTTTLRGNRIESVEAILHPAGAFAQRINGIETDIKHAVADIATVRSNSDNAYRMRGHLTERIVDCTEHANTLGARQDDIIATVESHRVAINHRISVNETKTTWAHETAHANLRSIADCGGDILTHRDRLDSLTADRDVHTKAIDVMTRRVSTLEQHVPQRLMEHSAAIARTREHLDAVETSFNAHLDDIETHTAGLDAAIARLDAVDIRAAVDARVGELCRIAAVGIVLLSAVFVAAATAAVGIARFLSMFLY